MGYIVGERGPEWFMPSSSGTIVPHGGGAVINNTRVINNLGVQATETTRSRRNRAGGMDTEIVLDQAIGRMIEDESRRSNAAVRRQQDRSLIRRQ